MDTTQKKRPAAPRSAQQENGALKTAQEQRTAAGRPARKPEQKPAKKEAAAEKQTKSRKGAPEKKAAPARKQEAARERTPKAEKSTERKPREAVPADKHRKQPAQSGKRQAAAKQPPVKGLPDSVSTKKRAYGNSKPKKKTALDLINDAVKRSGERKAEKIKARQAEREKGVREKTKATQPAQVVIYTEPKAFNRSRFLVQMITVLAVVVALVLGLSVFFKVETITVSGAEVYSAWAVREASGIQEDDNLLTFSHARAGAQIKANLPYVRSVRFGIKLPDTVNIIIEEEDVVYAIRTPDGTWWLMTSDGRMVEQTNSAVAAGYTQIVGVTVSDPVVNERAVATESAAVMETNEAGETTPVPVSVTGAQRLATALEIVQALEDNDIVGGAASVDVTRLEEIILWYGTRFQVNLGNSTNLGYKVACMNDVILQMGEYQTGILDISFTIWPNQVGFTPFA